MFPPTHGLTPRSLAEIRPSDTVQIRTILFGTLKDLCHGLGLAEGDVVCCVRSSPGILLLRTGTGRKVLFEMDWARFIAVAEPAVPLPRPSDLSPGDWPTTSGRSPHPEVVRGATGVQSDRSARTGSMRDARRAGIAAASSATSSIPSATVANIQGSTA